MRHCTADISKARKLLGYRPTLSFENGMRELVEWGKGAAATDAFDKAYEEMRSKGLLEG